MSNHIPEGYETATDHSHGSFRSGQTESTIVQGHSNLPDTPEIIMENVQSPSMLSNEQHGLPPAPWERMVDSPPPIEPEVLGKPFLKPRSTLEHGPVEHTEENQKKINELCPGEQGIVMVDGGNTEESQLMVYNAIMQYPPDADNKRVWAKVRVSGPKSKAEYRCKAMDRDGIRCYHRSSTPQKARQHFVAGHVDEPCWSCPIGGCSDPRKYKRLDDLKHHHMVQYHGLDYTRSRIRTMGPRPPPLRYRPSSSQTTPGPDGSAQLSAEVESERATREAWKQASPGLGKSRDKRRDVSTGSSRAGSPFSLSQEVDPYLSLLVSAYGAMYPPSNPPSVGTTPSEDVHSGSLHTPSSRDVPLPPLFELPSDETSASQSVPHSPVPQHQWYRHTEGPTTGPTMFPNIPISLSGDPLQNTLPPGQYPTWHAPNYVHGGFPMSGTPVSAGISSPGPILYVSPIGETHRGPSSMPRSAPAGSSGYCTYPTQCRPVAINGWGGFTIQGNPTQPRFEPSAAGFGNQYSAGISLSPVPSRPWQVPSSFAEPIGVASSDPPVGYGTGPVPRPIGNEPKPAAAVYYSRHDGIATAPPQSMLPSGGVRRPTSYDMPSTRQQGNFLAFNDSLYNPNPNTNQPQSGPYFSIPPTSATAPDSSHHHRRKWDEMAM